MVVAEWQLLADLSFADFLLWVQVDDDETAEFRCVTHAGDVIAVLSRETNLAVPRVPSSLEIAYLGVAGDLCQMVADGSFPTAEPAPGVHTSPRVGDGLIRLDSTGAVVFASPNAKS